MGLLFFAIYLAGCIAFIFLLVSGRVSLRAAIIFFVAGILFLGFLIVSVFGVGAILLLRVFAYIVGIGLVFLLIACLISKGTVSLIWWLGEDRSPLPEEKKRVCKACGAENMLGRRFCVKCGRKLELSGVLEGEGSEQSAGNS